MSGRLPGMLFVALLLVPGCSAPEKNHSDIIQALAIRTTALNSRDISGYMSVISPQYNDKGKNSVQLKVSLEKNFKDFEQLSYEAGTPSITVDGTGAESVCIYRMKVRVRGKEMTLNGTEHLKMVNESGGWKIIAGI